MRQKHTIKSTNEGKEIQLSWKSVYKAGELISFRDGIVQPLSMQMLPPVVKEGPRIFDMGADCLGRKVS